MKITIDYRGKVASIQIPDSDEDFPSEKISDLANQVYFWILSSIRPSKVKVYSIDKSTIDDVPQFLKEES